MAGELVLVVDDNAMNLKLVRFLLTKRGYRVRTASSADEALVALEAEAPALILMDLQLPGMDGLELTARLRERPALAQVPIVAVTASAMRGDEERALAAGCDGYVAKPIDTHTFPGIIAAHLARRAPQVP